MRIFAVSDIHGHYTELKKALDNAGFDSSDPNHILICCGDCFDRGSENRMVLEYLNSLERKILIRGNHEDILENILECRQLDRVDIYNGADITVYEFFGDASTDRNGRINLSNHTNTLNDLKDFLGSMYDFFETDRNVFTHAWLPIVRDDDKSALHPDFKYAEKSQWHSARYYEWVHALDSGLTLKDKAVVCGHRAACNAYKIDNSRDPDDFSIFQTPEVVAIDSLTVRTHKVNVYVTDDNIPRPKHHEMSLNRKFFDLIKERKKTLEIRLLDEKRKALSLGDVIEFTCAEAPEKKLVRRVVGLYRYDSLSLLTRDFSAAELGYTLAEFEHFPDEISQIYSEDQISEHGLLAIRLSHII